MLVLAEPTLCPRRSGARAVLGAVAVLVLTVYAAGCDESLPAFADPPPYDAGHLVDVGEDDDGG